MAQILVEDLDPVILEKLEILAKQHGRSLQEELKHILQQASEKATHYHTGGDIEKVRKAVARAQVIYTYAKMPDGDSRRKILQRS